MTDLETRLYHHVHYLSSDLGMRQSGTANNHAAAEYIAAAFRAANLEVELQPFACPSWSCQETSLALDDQPLEAAANAYSPACDVTAPFVPVCTLAELEAAELNGRVALLYGDLTRQPIACKSWFLKEARDQRIVELLEAGQPAAILTVQGAKELERIIEDWEFLLPSATVPAEVGRILLQQALPAAGSPGTSLHLRIAASQSPGETRNVVARKAGRGPAKIVLCAHYDTKVGTPGAIDNAVGVAVLLELAQALGHADLAANLELVAFTNEEYLPMGDDEYMRRGGEAALDQVLAAINFDGVGGLLGANNITAITGSTEFERAVRTARRAYPGVVWVEPWPESNHSSFTFRGVPAVAFSSTGAWGRAHTLADTIDWVSPAKLAEVYHLGLAVVQALQHRPLGWGRVPGM